MSELEQFWWNWVVQAVVALATIAAVLVALRLHLVLIPPKLSLKLTSRDGDKQTVAIGVTNAEGVVVQTSTRQARYYRVTLANERPLFTASEVDVYLVAVESEDAAGHYVEVWTGALPLVATHYGVHPSRTLGADPREYDLCSAVRDKWLELHPRIVPNNFPAKYRMEDGRVRLRVRLQARALEEVVSPRLSLELAWDGGWHDDPATMRRHMVVREL